MLISEIYRTYLQQISNRETIETFIKILHHVGLGHLAKAIYSFHILNRNSYEEPLTNGRRYFLGYYPPINAQIGDIWLDIVQLSPMMLIPFSQNYPSSTAWISVQPIMLWQFQVFLHLVKWQGNFLMNKQLSDMFSPAHFQDMDELSIVTNVYHEEAVAYAIWYEKILASEDILVAALKCDFLAPELKNNILPDGLWSWELLQSDDEAMRYRYSYDSQTNSTNQSEINEGYRGTDTTFILAHMGQNNARLTNVNDFVGKRKVYEFVTLLNSVKQYTQK